MSEQWWAIWEFLKNVYILLIHSCLYMAEKSSGTGQWRKLIYNKRYSDVQGVIWKLSPIKVLLWMLAITIILILTFSFFQEDQFSYLQDVLFYSIIIMIIMMVVWVVAMFVVKSRKLFVQFLIAWILILGLYWILGMACQVTGLFPNGFHYGVCTWILISALALMAKNIGDQSLDKRDIFYAMLVLIIVFIANAPIFSGGIGFLAQVDSVLGWIASKLSFINPQDLIAS